MCTIRKIHLLAHCADLLLLNLFLLLIYFGVVWTGGGGHKNVKSIKLQVKVKIYVHFTFSVQWARLESLAGCLSPGPYV